MYVILMSFPMSKLLNFLCSIAKRERVQCKSGLFEIVRLWAKKLACTSDVSQGIQEFSGKTLIMLFFDILIVLYFMQPKLCQYISFQPWTPVFVEFRLRSKATREFASLGYARIPYEATHHYTFGCIINNAKIGCPMTMTQ